MNLVKDDGQSVINHAQLKIGTLEGGQNLWSGTGPVRPFPSGWPRRGSGIGSGYEEITEHTHFLSLRLNPFPNK